MGRRGGLPVRIVCGRYEDRLAWMQTRIQENPELVVVCSSPEIPLLAKTGDCYIANTVRYEGMERICPDVARLAKGPEKFLDLIFPQEFYNSLRDGYWYTVARLVLEDVYSSAIYSFFRDSVSSKRHRVPVDFPDDYRANLTKSVLAIGRYLTDVLPADKTDVARGIERLKTIPDEYKSNILAQVVRNAPVTASCIVSIVQGSLSALRDYRCPGERLFHAVPQEDRTIFIAGDDMGNKAAVYLGAQAMERPVLATGYLPDNLLHRFRDVTCCYRCQNPADAFVFLPGRHPEFDQLLALPTVTSLRALPVELPENLEPGEALIYEDGAWKYRDDVMPALNFDSPLMDRKKGSGEWTAPYIKKVNDRLYIKKREEIKEQLRRRDALRRQGKKIEGEESGTKEF
jgi:hypothetical protein